MRNWKTTVAGLLIAIGTPMSQSDDSTMKSIGTILITLGSLLLGLMAKDYNNSAPGGPTHL